jgi:ABC-type nitrate/sulfonate/bicarbonate transport system substrate-binding protein
MEDVRSCKWESIGTRRWIQPRHRGISHHRERSFDPRRLSSHLASMGDLKKPYPLPFICAVTTKSYLAKNRSTVKRVVMALIEATQFFKTNKEAAQKIIAKYLRGANKAYLDSAYQSTAKIIERVPYTTREGMQIQLDDALKQAPGSKVTVDSLIDDSIVRELEKRRIYR